MTKVMIDGFGWVYLVVVLDWHTKKVVGHYAGLQAHAWHWLVALNRAVNRQFPNGIGGRSLNLMADNGCQPTALAFMRATAALGIRQAFTATATRRATPTPSASCARSRRSWSGFTSGPARPPSSRPWSAGSPTTTAATCTRPSATARPRPSKPNTSAAPLRQLAKRGAAQGAPPRPLPPAALTILSRSAARHSFTYISMSMLWATVAKKTVDFGDPSVERQADVERVYHPGGHELRESELDTG